MHYFNSFLGFTKEYKNHHSHWIEEIVKNEWILEKTCYPLSMQIPWKWESRFRGETRRMTRERIWEEVGSNGKLPCTIGIVVGWMSFLITKFLLSICDARPCLSLSPFPLFLRLLWDSLHSLMDLSLSFGRKDWTNLCSPKDC